MASLSASELQTRGWRSVSSRYLHAACRILCVSPHALRLAGFTLLEVLVAMAVLAVGLVSLLGLYNRSLTSTIHAQRLSIATLLVQEMLTRTQLEGATAMRVTSGDFSELHPGQYSEFRWNRTILPTPLKDLWEFRVSVSWGERSGESCELTLFAPLEGS